MAKNTAKKSKQKPRNWYADRYEFVIIQRNIMAILAMISLLAAAVAVYAVAALTGSKTLEPYVIEVEKKSGIVTAVKSNSLEEYKASEVIRRYFLTIYIQAREGYDPTDFKYNYNSVIRLMSSSTVFSQYRNQVAPENADSPLNMQHNHKRTVKIKSISFLDPEKKKAQIRISIDETSETGFIVPNKHQDKIATIDIDFADLKLTDEERMVNPLGFQVRSYRLDNDISG